MLSNHEGQAIPAVKLHQIVDGELSVVDSEAFFANKKVAIFSLPGAFTPTCSSAHLPRFSELKDSLVAEGFDEVVCLSVNDAFVMEAWRADQGIDNITLLADGNGAFTQGMGMLVDKSDLGFGLRSWRYSAVITNGVVEKHFIEPEVDGDPYEVSDADTLLEYVNPEAKKPPMVAIITKEGCPYCIKAKALLKEKGYRYEEVRQSHDSATVRVVRSITGQETVPQVFIDGEYIGGSEALEAYFA